MILLSDHTQTSGGFECVKGFHKKWNSWAKDNPIESIEGASPLHGLVYVPKNDPIYQDVQQIYGKAGN